MDLVRSAARGPRTPDRISANPPPDTRAKAGLLDLKRKSLNETRTLRRTETDTNFRSREDGLIIETILITSVSGSDRSQAR
jgi:hypothetical protein